MIREEESPRPSLRLSTTEELPSIAACRQHRAAEAERAGAGRARLDRDEGAGEGPQPAVRDGQRPGGRPAAVPGRRAGAGVPAVGRVSAAQAACGGTEARCWRRHWCLWRSLAGIVGTTWGLIRALQAGRPKPGSALAKANEQKALKEKRIADAVRNFLQHDLLRQAEPTAQANAVRRADGGFDTTENPTIKELLDRAAAELVPRKIEVKFPQQLEVQASILQTVGATYLGIGEFAKAVEFLTRASDTYRHALGADHPDTLATLGSLAAAAPFRREDGRGHCPVRACARRLHGEARARPPPDPHHPGWTWPERTFKPRRRPRPSPCACRCATLG